MMRISRSVVDSICGIESFRRVNEKHPLDLYIGKDVAARPTLLLVSENEPMQIYSSKMISVRVGKREDSRWSLSFSLNDPQVEDIFYHFCDDIINSSQGIHEKKQGTIFVCTRYQKWQELLKKNTSGLLSASEVKGLIGELIFLRDFMFEKYGVNNALLSWIGPDKADQDFVCSDYWYEVKSTVSGAEAVKISSVEQLDCETIGKLIIIYLDKTSRSDPKKITLNELVLDITNSLLTEEQKNIFGDILLNQGYIPRDEYDEYVFRCTSKAQYLVNKEFPSLRRKDISSAISSAQYMLSIAGIQGFLQED